MHLKLRLTVFVLVTLICQSVNASAFLSSQSILRSQDRKHLESVLSVSDTVLSEANLNTFYFQLNGLNVLYGENLNAPITSAQKQSFCEQLGQLLKTSSSVRSSIEALYYATSAVRLLNCPLPASTELTSLLEASQKAGASIDDLYRSSFALINLGKKINSVKVNGLLQTALNKNDSLLANGLAFQLASQFTPIDLAASYAKRILSVVEQADLVDSRFLQFEGGLGVTANVLLGIYKLANTIKKPIDLLPEQSAKFTNYFLTRRTVQAVKGASELLQILQILSSNNNVHVPVLIAPVEGTNQISASRPVYTIKIVNAFGQSLNRAFSVQIQNTDDASQFFKLDPVQGDSTLYAVDLYSTSTLSAGRYTFNVQTKPIKSDSHLVLPIETQVEIVIQDEITLEDVEVAVGEKDQLALKYEPVAYPARLSRSLDVDHTQKLGVQFRVRNTRTNVNILPNQAFLQFRRRSDGKQITFIADFERSTSTYRSSISMPARAKDFDYVAGAYDLFVLLGDSTAANAIAYHLAEVVLDLPTELAPQIHVKPWLKEEFTPLPELRHVFRAPEKRPPVIVSQVFTLLCIAPLPILLLAWLKIGINFSAFKFSLSALLFHSSLALVFILYSLFFWYLNMFTTVKCLSGVLLLAFWSGHRLLSSLAQSNSKLE